MNLKDLPKKKIYITDTILRDAHQSQAATRMRFCDMEPVLNAIDEVGYWSIECWGGATFDACMRYLDEDPWERLRKIKKAMPKTKLQMLLRGQNLLGYRNYSDDVVEEFCKKSIENGIDVVRIFDALNDARNIQAAMNSVKKHGGIVEAAICYTKSPVHSIHYFVDKAMTLEKMGADTICIKDMANLLLPFDAYELVREIKKKVSLPIHLHTHNTTGTGSMVYLAAVLAGADIIDCALSPLANGTSQPATETMVATFEETAYDTGIDLKQLKPIAKHFKGIVQQMEEEGLIDRKVLRADPDIFLNQIPGGMLSNLVSQLKQANAETQIDEVMDEIPIVRKDFGYPPLVTPTSQIVGTQAVFNVLYGRYNVFSKEAKALLKGEYGELPGEVDDIVRKKAIGNSHIIIERPADNLQPELSGIISTYGNLAKTEEDILSCAMYPNVAPEFIKRRDNLIVHEIAVEWN